MKNTSRLGMVLTLTACIAAPSYGQVEPVETTPLPQEIEATSNVELIPQRVVGKGRDLRGIRVARSGALLLASFDDDRSLSVSLAEIEKNAESAFQRADTNNSGTLSIFEQQDWARAVGSDDGPLANTVTFDANIDRQITSDEFKAGLIRLGNSYMSEGETEILFADLLIKPNGKKSEKRRTENKDNRPQRQNNSIK